MNVTCYLAQCVTLVPNSLFHFRSAENAEGRREIHKFFLFITPFYDFFASWFYLLFLCVLCASAVNPPLLFDFYP